MIGKTGKGKKSGRPKGSKNKGLVKMRPKPEIQNLSEEEQLSKIKELLKKNDGAIYATARDLGMSGNVLHGIINRNLELSTYVNDLRMLNWEKVDKILQEKSIQGDKEFCKMVLQYQTKMKEFGYSKDPEIQINNNINFRFKFDDGEKEIDNDE